MTQLDYGSTFAAWRAAAPQWEAYVRHPFVEGLRTGDLPREAFLRYLRQDYLFLIHFARAWALAVVKSETMEEMKTAASVTEALLNHEMRLHIETCAAEGIDERALRQTEEEQETLAYTRYVIDAGVSGDFLDLAAALAPCVLGYGEIGARLSREATPQGPYRDWIATYSGEDYQDLCRSVGALIDAAVARRLGEAPDTIPRWTSLANRFTTATRLEAAFWQMGLGAAR